MLYACEQKKRVGACAISAHSIPVIGRAYNMVNHALLRRLPEYIVNQLPKDVITTARFRNPHGSIFVYVDMKRKKFTPYVVFYNSTIRVKHGSFEDLQMANLAANWLTLQDKDVCLTSNSARKHVEAVAEAMLDGDMLAMRIGADSGGKPMCFPTLRVNAVQVKTIDEGMAAWNDNKNEEGENVSANITYCVDKCDEGTMEVTGKDAVECVATALTTAEFTEGVPCHRTERQKRLRAEAGEDIEDMDEDHEIASADAIRTLSSTEVCGAHRPCRGWVLRAKQLLDRNDCSVRVIALQVLRAAKNERCDVRQEDFDDLLSTAFNLDVNTVMELQTELGL